jgi:hypothetical protein
MEFVDAWCLVDIGKSRLFGTFMSGQFGSLFLGVFGKANDATFLTNESQARGRGKEFG